MRELVLEYLGQNPDAGISQVICACGARTAAQRRRVRDAWVAWRLACT